MNKTKTSIITLNKITSIFFALDITILAYLLLTLITYVIMLLTVLIVLFSNFFDTIIKSLPLLKIFLAIVISGKLLIKYNKEYAKMLEQNQYKKIILFTTIPMIIKIIIVIILYRVFFEYILYKGYIILTIIQTILLLVRLIMLNKLNKKHINI